MTTDIIIGLAAPLISSAIKKYTKDIINAYSNSYNQGIYTSFFNEINSGVTLKKFDSIQLSLNDVKYRTKDIPEKGKMALTNSIKNIESTITGLSNLYLKINGKVIDHYNTKYLASWRVFDLTDDNGYNLIEQFELMKKILYTQYKEFITFILPLYR